MAWQRTLQRAWRIYRREGVRGLRRGLRIVASAGRVSPVPNSDGFDRNDYTEWTRRYDTLSDDARARMRARMASWPMQPSISVVMPTYNPRLEWLQAAIGSVRQQIFTNWQLCIADDASTDRVVRPALERHSAEDSRIVVEFRTANGHISAASNSAVARATGDWIVLLDHDDVLAEDALFWLADAIVTHPEAQLIYSDEDKLDDQGRRCDPYFKSDWNVDLFYSHNLFCHLGAYRSTLLRQVGGFRVGTEGAQDYDLALRCSERVGAGAIHHIPRVLYHWRKHHGSTAYSGDAKSYASPAGQHVLQDHFARVDARATVRPVTCGYRVQYQLPPAAPLVTIIIPTRNGVGVLRRCVASILERTAYSNYELLIVDNGSADPATLQYLRDIASDRRVRTCRDDRPFNFSALNNAAVQSAAGTVISFANNDLEVITPEWLTEMTSLALQPGVGAVGAKLLYPDNTLQHGGIILGVGGVGGHAHKGLHRDLFGYGCRAMLTQSLSAVTAACMVVRKEVFEEVGGFDENLAVAFNDVDLCLRVRNAGYRNVWTPFAQLYHHESATRGYEDTHERLSRFTAEGDYLRQRWGDMLSSDPAYNPNLTLDSEDFSLAWPPRVGPA